MTAVNGYDFAMAAIKDNATIHYASHKMWSCISFLKRKGTTPNCKDKLMDSTICSVIDSRFVSG